MGGSAVDGPQHGRYDVVVVGAGLAGLTAGALLAREGQRVVVVEARDEPGGYCASLVSGGYRFDPAVHLAMGGGPASTTSGLITGILEQLGTADRCELVAVDPFYEARFPDMAVRVPAGREGFLEAHAEAVPADADGLGRLLDLGDRLYDEFIEFPLAPRPDDLLRAPMRFPTMTRHLFSTVGAVTARYLDDPRMRALYMALFPYVGLPPSQESFVVWSVMLASYVNEGAYFCLGGFQRLADALAEGLIGNGGELVLGRRVTGIGVAGDRVTGVQLDDGQSIRATQVVATGDARRTMSDLVGLEHLPRRYARRLTRPELSVSVYEMYLGTDLDVATFDPAPETIIHRTWDLDASFRAGLAGGATSVMVTIPTLTDPSLAPDGCHQVVVAGLAPEPGLGTDEDRLAAQYLQAAEEVVPGLGDHLVHVTGADRTPTGQRPPPLHRIDTIYGWATTPRQSGMWRLPATTPVGGLTLAGQWTRPAHGVWTVMASGLQAARHVLGRDPARGVAPPAV